MKLTIDKMIYGGDALGHLPPDESGRGKTAFVPFVLPGEEVEVSLSEEKPGFIRAKAETVLAPSPQRTEAPCPYFVRCGGCHYQHAAYEIQLQLKSDILREARETLEILQQENANHPDLADRASSETDRAIELRARDRQRKLISKIDAALHRIEDGTYGYCEETAEPIALRRLEARPIATLSIEAQERHERMERTHRDD